MGRVKLDLPDLFVFSTDLPVRITDINYGGHLGNDAVLSLMHEARVRFLGSSGFTEMDAGGPGIIMTDTVIVYRSEAFYGETIVVQVALGPFSRVGCDVFYRLSEKEADREVARAKTGIVFYDYGERRAVAVPETFRSAFSPG